VLGRGEGLPGRVEGTRAARVRSSASRPRLAIAPGDRRVRAEGAHLELDDADRLSRCAAAGGTVLLIQTLMMLFRRRRPRRRRACTPTTSDHRQREQRRAPRRRQRGSRSSPCASIAAFLTFFGLAGWGGRTRAGGPSRRSARAPRGTAMLFAVAWIFSFQKKPLLGREPRSAERGRARRPACTCASPRRNSGKGKITVSIQGRTHEFNALTTRRGDPDGARGQGARVRSPQDTFEVGPLAVSRSGREEARRGR
jgi:hypothetical protein